MIGKYMNDKLDPSSVPGTYVPDALWETFKITPEMLKDLQVIESSIYLTRNCNLKCQYCKIINTEVEGELSTERWIEAFDILNDIGIRFVNIAGGEPTIVKGLIPMIEHLSQNTSMEFSIVSNSLFGEVKAREMAEAGLKNFVASVDVVGGEDQSLDELRKSSAGVKALAMLRGLGVENLCANIVINATNLADVLEATRVLSDEGVWVNICPIVWGKGDKWDEPSEEDLAYQLTDSHRSQLSEVSEELVKMKRAGALILPTEEYIVSIPEYGISLGWKCYSDDKKVPTAETYH